MGENQWELNVRILLNTKEKFSIYIVEGLALLHVFLVFSVSFRRVTLQQNGDYHVAIKAQDIRTGSQRSL